MAHERTRYIESNIMEMLRWSPAVGLFGLRQVGKTTLMKALVKKLGAEYETFDSEPALVSAENRPVEFCTRDKLLCLDEAQKAPEIFPAIKLIIGTARKPGQFFLTGSIKFTLKNNVRESLTGRILLTELLPFNIAEVRKLKVSNFLEKCFLLTKSFDFKKSESLFSNLRKTDEKHIIRHTFSGGMPIPCFSNEPKKRTFWFSSYFDSVMSRDLLLVDESLAGISSRQTTGLIRQLAYLQGKPMNISSLQGDFGINPSKLRLFIRALETLSLIDLIYPEKHSKKSILKPKLEWKDTGLWTHAVGLEEKDIKDNEQAIRASISQEFRTQLSLLNPQPHWTYYKTRDGADIPWVFRQGDSTVVVKLSLTEKVSRYDLNAFRVFLKKEKKAIGIILGSKLAGNYLVDERVFSIPYTDIF